MVNTSIYGVPESWLPIVSGSSVKLVNFGNDKSTINGGFEEGKLIDNKPLDKSLCHSALGTESALSHLHWYTQGSEFAVDDYASVPFCFGSGWDSIANNRYFFPSGSVQDHIYGSTVPYSPSINNNLVADFDYKRLRALIRVVASNYEGTPQVLGNVDVDLDSYINDYASSYPYIRYGYISLYELNSDNIASLLNYYGGKGIINFNQQSVYKGIKKSSSERYNPNYCYLLHGNSVPSGYTPYNSNIIILGLTSSYGGATDTADRINKAYINSFTEGVEVHTVGNFTYAYRLYDTGFYEYIKHQAACFGIQFVTSYDNISINIESEETSEDDLNKVFIGVLDSNYIGHGDYVTGKKILDTQQYALNSANDSPFDPSKETDPNRYYNDSVKPHNVVGTTAFTTKYVLNFASLNAIADSFYTALDLKPDDMDFNNYNTSLFLTNNALDTIISCKAFPFEVPSSGSEVVQFGKFKTTVSAPVTNRKVTTFEFSGFSCFPEYDDFRDYEPYTSYELKVPYCGSVKLQPSEVVGKSISVTLCVDIETGDTTAFIYADNQLIDSLSGNCAVDVPLSGIQQATLDSQVFNASLNQRQAKINSQLVTAKGIISIGGSAYGLAKSKGNPTALAKGLGDIASSATNFIQSEADAYFNEKRTDYELSHVQTPYKCVGSVSAGVGLSESQVCTLTKYSPVMLGFNKNVYARTIGYACLIEGSLSGFSGYTVCSNADLSGFYATAEEKQAILQALQGGVIL